MSKHNSKSILLMAGAKVRFVLNKKNEDYNALVCMDSGLPLSTSGNLICR